MRRAALVALVLLTTAPASADPLVHVVAVGDTLGELAERYRVSVSQLRSWNHLRGDTIRVGQTLTVEDVPTIRYRTVPGDTLGCIAQRHRISVSRIREDNPHLRRRLDAGVTLRLRGAVDPRAHDSDEATAPEHHTVTRGENLTRIARRAGITLEALRALNPTLADDRVRVGQRLVVGQAPRSESVGVPWCGHIAGARQLGRHPAYVLRNPARSWATASTITRLRRGFDHMQRRHRRAPRVRVHDLSLRHGGAIDDHRSHQSGRDVDITYYRRRGCGRNGCPLEDVDPGDLDVRRQWALLRTWLERDELEAVYIDYALQRPLYREARRRGATRAQLRRWFQFPRGRRAREGVVRHFPHHRDHLHARFACSRGERRCR